MTNLSPTIEKIVKEFKKEFIQETDSGIIINWISKNGFDFDDWLPDKLQEVEKEARQQAFKQIEEIIQADQKLEDPEMCEHCRKCNHPLMWEIRRNQYQRVILAKINEKD